MWKLKFIVLLCICAFILHNVLPGVTGFTVTGNYWEALGVYALFAVVLLVGIFVFALASVGVGLLRRQDSKEHFSAVLAIPVAFLIAATLRLMAYFFPGVLQIDSWTAAWIASFVLLGISGITDKLGKLFD